ncbi:hypothetical protein DUNSADRAFT_3116 [Dunaliella salina]|uniref:Encoded protein n=1 Tax=Dunaliella salina TaxID=3046 RepID=A0ABQ7H803_DUNSA|nr:hypothetical protein DUNSADRAFT_3116 [Dunaliella salina]|eukprot:KAF5842987.1 hypothetical protein DUNSADRAFT_3116 [Dunaliella salina]
MIRLCRLSRSALSNTKQRVCLVARGLNKGCVQAVTQCTKQPAHSPDQDLQQQGTCAAWCPA